MKIGIVVPRLGVAECFARLLAGLREHGELLRCDEMIGASAARATFEDLRREAGRCYLEGRICYCCVLQRLPSGGRIQADVNFGDDLGGSGLDICGWVDLCGDREAVARDAMEIFLRFSGLAPSSAPAPCVLHAAMYADYWTWPLSCSAVYHRDAVEFARDFYCIYWYKRWCMVAPSLLRESQFELFLEADAPCGEARGDLWRQEYFLTGHPSFRVWKTDESCRAVAELLSRLDYDLARRLSNAAPEQVLAALATLPEALRSTHLLDFGERGLVMASNWPQSVLWQPYLYLAEQLS